MCDFRQEIVRNMRKNCEINQVINVESVLVDLNDFDNYEKAYDMVLSTNLFGEGFSGFNILNLWRRLLKVGGEAILIVPDRKDEVKKFMDIIDRTQFKINNLILTADEYEASPIFNKIQGEAQFPLIGKSTFYAIGLTKLRQGQIHRLNESVEK